MEGEREAFEAVSGGDAARLRALLEDDPGLAAARGPDGVSLLLRAQYAMSDELVAAVLAAAPELDVHEAAAVGDADRVRALLDGRPELMRAVAADGFAPLHAAAAGGDRELVALLLESGADPAPRSDDGRTPAALARERGHRELEGLLRA